MSCTSARIEPTGSGARGVRRDGPGSIRRECLDHIIILNAAHLRRVLQAYAEYYNSDRTHLALDKDAPNSRPVERTGRIVSRPILGGLHRRYGRKTR